MSFLPTIIIKTGKQMGYGGPDVYWSRGIFNNRLLWSVKAGSARSEGAETEQLRLKWDRRWKSEEEFLAKVALRPLASEICSNCHQDTIEGLSSCLDRAWCQREECRAALEAAREQYRIDANRLEEDRRIEEKRRAEDRIAALWSFTCGAINWDDFWFIKRQADGSVRVIEWRDDGLGYPDTDVTIPASVLERLA